MEGLKLRLKVKKVITWVKIFLLLTLSILTLSLLHKECGPLCGVNDPLGGAE